MFLRSPEKTGSDRSGRKKSRKISEKSDLNDVKRVGDTSKNSEQVELWTKVVGRKEIKQSSEKKKEKIVYRKDRGTEKSVVRKKKPLKTSAVIITVKNDQISYSLGGS